MDEADRKILSILRKNSRASLKEIAQEVYLSSPAVSARIARLEKAGYIEEYVAILSPPKLGYLIKAFINLEVSPVQRAEFYQYIRNEPNVVECNCVTGDYSMLIEVFFPSTEELDIFVGELQRFGRTRTQIVFSTSVEHRQVQVPDRPVDVTAAKKRM
ncbi:MAG: Lrp/AsnC family transcriptional regulator [Clostridiales bacterium]|nr:Lrp/AsnC family transcriptional regulator [Clostridiales bacterium]